MRWQLWAGVWMLARSTGQFTTRGALAGATKALRGSPCLMSQTGNTAHPSSRHIVWPLQISVCPRHARMEALHGRIVPATVPIHGLGATAEHAVRAVLLVSRSMQPPVHANVQLENGARAASTMLKSSSSPQRRMESIIRGILILNLRWSGAWSTFTTMRRIQPRMRSQ